MRRLVVVLLAASLAFVLAGCGGGDKKADEASQNASATAEASAPVAPPRGMVFEPFPVAEGRPAAVQANLDKSAPMILFFYDGSQKVSKDIRSQIDKALDETDGAAELVEFDLGKYTGVLEDGSINIDAEALKGDAEAQAAVSLATDLGLTMAPSVVVSDDQNHVIFRTTGFLDKDLIIQQLERVSQ